MKSALKDYLDEERGRATRLADELNVARSYVSDLANGKKRGSVDILRRISELTGISFALLAGATTGDSLHDEATPFIPPPVPPGATLDAYLAPNSQHRLTWRSTVGAPIFGILAGDLLVIDMRRAPQSGELVLASIIDNNEAETRIARYAPPWLITADPREPPIDAAFARIQGPIIAVARGAALEPA